MNKAEQKQKKRQMRHKRIRARVRGSAERPRLAIFRSNRYCYAQVIDDTKNVTLCSVSELNLSKDDRRAKPLEKAMIIGKMLANIAEKKGVKSVVFDRGGFLYTGLIKALALGARAGGLKF
ncbi:MAG: 50S ribosomal protein L18 [Parcubacteria group bacterium RIFCSPHIGHO2_01_FULL_45_26]|nr:ribosomal protein L18 [uncultured bacterium]OHB17543.1 MAG: 50S ribosomal protein L18 [Parcubacteria group bacterium RIFCSPHIGHO2_01_FULL_45_26]